MNDSHLKNIDLSAIIRTSRWMGLVLLIIQIVLLCVRLDGGDIDWIEKTLFGIGIAVSGFSVAMAIKYSQVEGAGNSILNLYSSSILSFGMFAILFIKLAPTWAESSSRWIYDEYASYYLLAMLVTFIGNLIWTCKNRNYRTVFKDIQERIKSNANSSLGRKKSKYSIGAPWVLALAFIIYVIAATKIGWQEAKLYIAFISAICAGPAIISIWLVNTLCSDAPNSTLDTDEQARRST